METKLFPTTPECEIVSTRTFNVSKELLFSAWSNPNHLKNWWGPKGFSNTFNEFDFREGGKWDFIMHSPEKGNYHNEVEFVKIEQPNIIAWKRYSKPLFKVVFTFETLNENETKLVFRMVFDTEEECNKIKGFAVDKNEENFDRLEEELKKMV
ncbi:MAG TPA: SRPBCC family protein [Flavobacterium sp.]|nr:SRPBCC family protein [Flavobacterium sp.]